MSTEQPLNENEAKEVSLLKQNLKFIASVSLGKSKPPALLKWLCYFFIVWDLLLTVYYLMIGLGKSILKLSSSNANMENYGYTFVLLHLVSLVGVLLLWRKKLTGLYVFAIANITMIVITLLMAPMDSLAITAIFFTVIAIGLFALNWNKFDYVVRKKAKLKAAQKISDQQA